MDLLEAIRKKGLLEEYGSNKYYRKWCFLDEPKPEYREWIYNHIKEEYERIKGEKEKGVIP